MVSGQVVGQSVRAKMFGQSGWQMWFGNVVGQCVWAKWLTTKENIR